MVRQWSWPASAPQAGNIESRSRQEREEDTPGLAWGVAASGGYIHVADYDAGVEIFRVCPEWPFADGFESGDTSAWSATVP